MSGYAAMRYYRTLGGRGGGSSYYGGSSGGFATVVVAFLIGVIIAAIIAAILLLSGVIKLPMMSTTSPTNDRVAVAEFVSNYNDVYERIAGLSDQELRGAIGEQLSLVDSSRVIVTTASAVGSRIAPDWAHYALSTYDENKGTNARKLFDNINEMYEGYDGERVSEILVNHLLNSRNIQKLQVGLACLTAANGLRLARTNPQLARY